MSRVQKINNQKNSLISSNDILPHLSKISHEISNLKDQINNEMTLYYEQLPNTTLQKSSKKQQIVDINKLSRITPSLPQTRKILSQYTNPIIQPSQQKIQKKYNKSQIKTSTNFYPQIISRESRLNPNADVSFKSQQFQQGIERLQQQYANFKKQDQGVYLQQNQPILNHFRSTFFKEKKYQIFNKTDIWKIDENEKNVTQDVGWLTDPGIIERAQNITIDKNEPIQQEKQSEKLNLEIIVIMQQQGPIIDSVYLANKVSYGYLWGRVQTLFNRYQKLMDIYKVQIFKICIKSVIQLILSLQVVRDFQLLSCLINKEIALTIKLRKIKNMNEDEASKIIGRFFLLHIKQQRYKKMIKQQRGLKILQEQLYLFMTFKRTKNYTAFHQKNLQNKVKELNRIFQNDWPKIKLRKRYEIHYHGFNRTQFSRNSTEKILHQKNRHIGRIFNLQDPNVYIIYILPFAISDAFQKYYLKLLHIHQIPNLETRIRFITPAFEDKFPHHYSLSKILYYSTPTLIQIKNIIKNYPSYLVPSDPGSVDYQIAAFLQIPIYGGNTLLSQELSRKSQAKILLNSLNLPVSPFLVVDAGSLLSIQELLKKFTSLVVSDYTVEGWVFKMEQQGGGKGIAIFKVNCLQISSLLNINNLADLKYHQEKVQQILQDGITKKLYIACRTLYMDEIDYLQRFIKEGGIIEAHGLVSQEESPSILINIEPDGNSTIVGSFDKISIQPYQNAGILAPQTSLENIDSEFLVANLVKRLYAMEIYGYIAVDLIAFPIHGKMIFWVNGLDCFLNDSMAGHFFFQYMTQSQYCKDINMYSNGNQNKAFMYFPFLYHPAWTNLNQNTFFKMIRECDLYFDVLQQKGSSFLLLDDSSYGMTGLMTIGNQVWDVSSLMNDTLNSLISKFGAVQKKSIFEFDKQMPEMQAKKQYTYFMDIVITIRLLNKKNSI